MNLLGQLVPLRLKSCGKSHQLALSCQRYVSTSEFHRQVASLCQKYASSRELNRLGAFSCQWYASTNTLSHRGASSCQRYASTSALSRRGVFICQKNDSPNEPRYRLWSSPSWFLRPKKTAIIPVRSSNARQWKHQVRVKAFSEIPGSTSLSLVVNILQVLHQKEVENTLFHQVFESMFKKHGPIFKMDLPGVPTTVVTKNPDDIETFFKSTLDVPTREVFLSLKTIQNNAPNHYSKKRNGLLCGNGTEWQRLRCRVQGTLLKPHGVASYLPQVDKTTKAYMERIDTLQAKRGRIANNFLENTYLWALECLCHIVMDRELGCLEPGLSPNSLPMQTARHVTDLFTAMYDLEGSNKTWMLYKTKSYVKMETAHRALLGIADRTVEEASRRLAKTKDDPHRTLSMMETLLSTEGLSKSDVVTVIMDLFVGSVDTTSHSLAFMLYHLATNPKAQKKLQEEVDTVLGDATDLLPEHIDDMTYLSYVVKESLRIHPVTIGTARDLQKDVVMSGYKVPAGTMALGANMLICNDDAYFHRAKEFLPERWAPERPLGPIHPFASLPFSYGTRQCIGKRIAEQEIHTFLIRAMQKYSITFESSRKMKLQTVPFLKPTIPLAFKFHHRK